MKTIKTYLKSPVTKHLLFWICVLLYFVLTASMNYYSGYKQVIEFNLMVISTQIITAYTCIYILIPTFLNQKKYIQFSLWLLILLVAMFALYNLFKIYYYDPKYYETYNEIGKLYVKKSFLKRFTQISVFLSKTLKFLTPTVLLLMARFYKNQQQFLQLNEQKKTVELTALKNQLNPHFLFNTLNNLYSLAIEKSEKTPEVIERLSDILDYMLYRCKDKFVPLQKEIELIENYLALEKVRYGKRVTISFEKNIEKEVKIAPLLLLTFIENAFKHGVSQELKKAVIKIDVSVKDEVILFSITNSKPNYNNNTKSETEALGLKNVKKQLGLLYPEAYNLNITDHEHQFLVTLVLNRF